MSWVTISRDRFSSESRVTLSPLRRIALSAAVSSKRLRLSAKSRITLDRRLTLSFVRKRRSANCFLKTSTRRSREFSSAFSNRRSYNS